MIQYKLVVTLPEPKDGYWDGARKKQVFEFIPSSCRVVIFPETDRDFQPKAWYRWGSSSANFWFHCLSGKSPKAAAQYAKTRLISLCFELFKVSRDKIKIEERTIA